VIKGLPPDIENFDVVDSLEVREPGRRGIPDDKCLGIEPDPELGTAGGEIDEVGKGEGPSSTERGSAGAGNAIGRELPVMLFSERSFPVSSAGGGGDVGGACASNRDKDDGLAFGDELSRVRTEKAWDPDGWNVSSIVASGGLAGMLAASANDELTSPPSKSPCFPTAMV
jgi:hypothetical protein